MLGFGSYDRVIDTLDNWLQDKDFVCGGRFALADVYCGSQVDLGLQFGTMPERVVLLAYRERIEARPAYQAAKAIDMALIAQAQPQDAGPTVS